MKSTYVYVILGIIIIELVNSSSMISKQLLVDYKLKKNNA